MTPGDQFDVTLQDNELLDEVELVTHVIVAATEADDEMSQEEVDEVLGVEVPQPRGDE